MADLVMEEDEDWMRDLAPLIEKSPVMKKRQKRVLTLDDLLEADRKETVRKLKSKIKRRKKLKTKSKLYASSEEDEGLRVPVLRGHIDDLEKKIARGDDGEEVEAEWGALVFAAQLKFPSLLHTAPRETEFSHVELQQLPKARDSFECCGTDHGVRICDVVMAAGLLLLTRGGAPSLQRALQASKKEGNTTSLEELARSGLLRPWALCTNRCDESTLRWAYHQMAYSSDASVEKATCKFLCDLVSQIATDSRAPFQMAWLPTLVDFKQTLVVYGYKEGSKYSENMDCSNENIEKGTPKNLRSVLEFIATSFVTRNVQPYYSVVDIGSLLVIMVHLTLERGLLEIMDKVQDCILALIRYLIPEEWEEVCPRVAEGISNLTQRPHNGVFLLGVLSGLGHRSVDLQRRLALHELTKLAGRKKLLATPREVAALFENVNLKAKAVDFEKFYYQVVIADTFLWCNEGLNDEIARSTWLDFLGLCSRQIFIGHERPFATKLRNRASFLVQKYEHESHGRQDSPARSVQENFD